MSQKKNTKQSSWLVEIQSCAMSTEDGRAFQFALPTDGTQASQKGLSETGSLSKFSGPFSTLFFLM